MAKDKYAPDELLTKMECCHLFCDKLKIGINSYYNYYYKHIKFKYYGKIINDDGEVEKRLPRIPYKIAMGLINLLQDRHDPKRDPKVETLLKYMKNVPEHVHQ